MKKMTRILSIFMLATLSFMMVACQSAESKLFDKVEEANKECPERDEEMTLEKVFIEDNNVVFLAEVDESYGMTIADFEYNISQMSKDEVAEAFTDTAEDEDEEELFDLCKEAKYNIIFRFVGKQTGDKTQVKISYKDL